jgi:hypothetical protein
MFFNTLWGAEGRPAIRDTPDAFASGFATQ